MSTWAVLRTSRLQPTDGTGRDRRRSSWRVADDALGHEHRVVLVAIELEPRGSDLPVRESFLTSPVSRSGKETTLTKRISAWSTGKTSSGRTAPIFSVWLPT